MASTMQCEPGRNRSGVTVDVTGAQEFLRYRVCITRGARNDGIIVDEAGAIVLDERHEVSSRCREREYPREGESVDVGVVEHTLVVVFARAVEYTYRVTLHHGDGSLKAWIKDCTYTRTQQTDHRAVGLTVQIL